MTRRAHLAKRRIPVADPAPVQLVLGLRWERPIERVEAIAPDPEPQAMRAVAQARRVAA